LKLRLRKRASALNVAIVAPLEGTEEIVVDVLLVEIVQTGGLDVNALSVLLVGVEMRESL
jgi:hypothetical protein